MAYKIDIVFDILKAIAFLPEVSQYRVLKASLSYLKNGSDEPLEGVENVAFKVLLPMLDEAIKKEQSLRVARSKSGKQGGRGKAKKANALFALDKENTFSSLPPTPPILSNPKEIYTSPNTHTREESEYIRQYREEGMWMDVAMILHKPVPECEQLFDRWVVEYQHNGDKHSTYSDFKKHFIQWARITIQKETKNGNNRQDYSRRGRAEVPTDISVDF